MHLGYGRTRGGRVADGKGFDAYALRASGAPWAGAGPRDRARRSGARRSRRRSTTTAWKGATSSAPSRPRRTARTRGRREAWARRRRARRTRSTRSCRPAATPGASRSTSSTCVGCNACVIACQSENNIPVVGKDEVARGRALQWIRIDRYYKGGLDNPETAPPARDLHALRERAVRDRLPRQRDRPQRRRPEPDGLQPLRRHAVLLEQLPVQGAALQLLPLHRLHDRDPEAGRATRTSRVRSRGVMEKCSYCVQRINRARYAAEKENRPIKDGEIVTACQQACPAQAIVVRQHRGPAVARSRRRRPRRATTAC